MAVTDTKKYTVQEKLNKMDVDLIDVTLLTQAANVDTTNGYGVGTSYNGDTLGSITLPAGMTIYGHWTAFTLGSGKIIAYQG